MHIPDGLLDSKVSAGLVGLAAVALAYSLAKVREMVTALAPSAALATVGKGTGNIFVGLRRVVTGDGVKLLYKMGLVASLVYIAQMLDFPVGGGTTGHLMGGVLAAVILGPFAGTIVIAAVLTAQMLFLSDGGLLAIGANIINMAFFGTMVAYYIYYFMKRVVPEWSAIFLAAWASVVMAAFACALELGLSGTAPLVIVIPAMVKSHAVIGLAEALITLGLLLAFRSRDLIKA